MSPPFAPRVGAAVAEPPSRGEPRPPRACPRRLTWLIPGQAAQTWPARYAPGGCAGKTLLPLDERVFDKLGRRRVLTARCRPPCCGRLFPGQKGPAAERNLALSRYESASSHAVGCFFEHQERVGTDTIELHGVGRRFGLHELLEGFHVGDFHDQPHPVRLRGKSWAVIPKGPKTSWRPGERSQ